MVPLSSRPERSSRQDTHVPVRPTIRSGNLNHRGVPSAGVVIRALSKDTAGSTINYLDLFLV